MDGKTTEKPEVCQTVVGDQNIFTATGDIRINYNLQPAAAEERRMLSNLADSVKRFWIEGVLESSLGEVAILELRKESEPTALQHPWGRILELPAQPSRSLDAEKRIAEIFLETGRALLILGEPGAGKTLTLLALARELIEHYERDPAAAVPVVLNLSNWRDSRRSLDLWIEGEMKSKYFVPARRTRAWLESSRLFLLLDGLDEVPAVSRASCVQAINSFLENTGAPGIAVCSRRSEYIALQKKLRFNAAVCLQPLTLDQINGYLDLGGNSLATVRETIRNDPDLQELVRSPLMLNVISLAYQGIPPDDLADHGDRTDADRRRHLFRSYVRRMFQRVGGVPGAFSQASVERWLSCLARGMQNHSQTVFLLEDLQPSWLLGAEQRWTYAILSRVFIALAWMILLSFSNLVLQPLLFGVGTFFTGIVCMFLTGAVAGLTAGAFAGWRLTSNRRHRGPTLLNILVEVSIQIALFSAIFAAVAIPFRIAIYTFLSGFPLPILKGVSILVVLDLPLGTALHRITLHSSQLAAIGANCGLGFGLLFGSKTARRTADSDIRLSGTFKFSLAAVRKAVKRGAISGSIIGLLLAAFGIWLKWPQFTAIMPAIFLGVSFLPLFCVSIAIVCALLFACIGVLLTLFSRSELPEKARPGQGVIWSSLKALWAGVAIAILSGMLELLDRNMVDVRGTAISAIALGLFAALWYGGFDVIQHLTLRLLLVVQGSIPNN